MTDRVLEGGTTQRHLEGDVTVRTLEGIPDVEPLYNPKLLLMGVGA